VRCATCLHDSIAGGYQHSYAAAVGASSCTQHADTADSADVVLVCWVCCSCSSGIPLAFPQWRDGQLPYNGFADKLEWTVVGTVRHAQAVRKDQNTQLTGCNCCYWHSSRQPVANDVSHLWSVHPQKPVLRSTNRCEGSIAACVT
jgi:hypothetical protein